MYEDVVGSYGNLFQRGMLKSCFLTMTPYPNEKLFFFSVILISKFYMPIQSTQLVKITYII